MGERPTHADLVMIACRWLRNKKRCGLVFAEPGKNVCIEEPDALGFKATGSHSLVVEVKTSRGDFLADQGKPHREGPGMGSCRWYMVPKGLVKPEETPEGWGLLYVAGKSVREIVDAPNRGFDRDVQGELTWLYCATRRHQLGVRWDAKGFRFDPVRQKEVRDGRCV